MVKQTSHSRGLEGETIAKAYLRAKGYSIKAERHKTPVGEIDLIATKRNLVAFIEVKRYATLDKAAQSISIRQKQRISRAAQLWVQENLEFQSKDLRFDALLIYGRGLGLRIKHLPNAWMMNEINFS